MDIKRPIQRIYKESVAEGERMENCVGEKTQEYIFDDMGEGSQGGSRNPPSG